MASRRILGPGVRAIREAQGVPQGVLASLAGISPGYLTLIEQGKRRPSPEVIEKIANGLGVKLDAISYFAEEANAA